MSCSDSEKTLELIKDYYIGLISLVNEGDVHFGALDIDAIDIVLGDDWKGSPVPKHIMVYDDSFGIGGDDPICKCGHRYRRHFDPFENDEPVGCKYCRCQWWEDPNG